MRNHPPASRASPSGLTWVYGVVQQAILFGKKCYGSTEVSKSSGVGSTPSFPAITSPHGDPVAGFWRCARPKTAPKAQRASTGD